MQRVMWGVLGGFVLITAFSSFGVVATGERGVKLQLGKVLGTVQPGLYFKFPFIQNVDVTNIQTQKEQTEADAASSDLQTVKTTIAVNWNIVPEKLTELYTRVGSGFGSTIIDPAIQEVVKAVTAKYTAEELITKRSQVTDDIQTALADKLALNDIYVSSVSIVNFNFSEQFNQAIEAKVTAEQNALAAKNKLDQVTYEGQQTVVTAKAQAEAIQIQAQAIQQQGGVNYVQLQAVNKWDGALPTYLMGGTVPFLNIPNR